MSYTLTDSDGETVDTITVKTSTGLEKSITINIPSFKSEVILSAEVTKYDVAATTYKIKAKLSKSAGSIKSAEIYMATHDKVKDIETFARTASRGDYTYYEASCKIAGNINNTNNKYYLKLETADGSEGVIWLTNSKV